MNLLEIAQALLDGKTLIDHQGQTYRLISHSTVTNNWAIVSGCFHSDQLTNMCSLEILTKEKRKILKQRRKEKLMQMKEKSLIGMQKMKEIEKKIELIEKQHKEKS